MASKEYQKQWRDNHPESCKKSKRLYYSTHPEYRKKLIKDSEKWKKNHPEKVKQISRRASIKCSYGLSYEDWLKIWKNQDGKCAICGEIFTKPSNAYTDHDHKTDEIRGLLCRKCNFGIGLFNDNPELLMNAIRYLQK